MSRKKLHHFVVPSKKNKHHPHALRHGVIVGVLLLVAVIEAGALFQSTVTLRNGEMLGAVLPGVVASLTNDARAANHMAPLIQNELLAQAAQNKAHDMATRGYFSHMAPDGSAPWEWIKQTGYAYSYAGENLAVNFTDSNQLVEAWMESPEHRANILKGTYTQIGVGMATGTYQGKEAVFVVQYFALPKTPTAPPQIAKAPASTQTQAPAPLARASSTQVVLGASVAEFTPQPAASIFTRMGASPRSMANVVLLALLVFFSALFVLGAWLGSRLPHPSAIVNTLVLVVVLLAFVAVNSGYLFGAPLALANEAQQITIDSMQ